MGILGSIKEHFLMRAAAKELQKSPVLMAALKASAETFDSTGLKDMPEDYKLKRSEELMGLVYQIISDENPVATCRHFLTDAVISFAKYQVLVLDQDADHDPTGLIGTQGISGNLKPLLVEIVEANTNLKEELYGNIEDPTNDEIEMFVMVKYWEAAWFAQTLNACRIALEDINPIAHKDWYMPFKHAMCVVEEIFYRNELDIEQAPEIDGVEHLGYYFAFANYVKSDCRYPDLSWREKFKDEIESGALAPPFPKEL